MFENIESHNSDQKHNVPIKGESNKVEKKAPDINDFLILKPISRGAFGKVFLGHKHGEPERKYAIKVMKKEDMVHKNMVQQVIAEKNALSLSKSPFIVHLYYCLQTVESVFLVMEYMIGGDVKSLLTMYGFFEQRMAVIYTMQVVQALDYLHRRSIIHRDLKPDNMLISKEGRIKLTDFGLSKISHNKQVRICDLLNTPGVQRKLYSRTPGQVLSLTSTLSFTLPDRRRLAISEANPGSIAAASMNRSFMDSPFKPCSSTASQGREAGGGVGSGREDGGGREGRMGGGGGGEGSEGCPGWEGRVVHDTPPHTPGTATPPPVCCLTPTLRMSNSWRKQSIDEVGLAGSWAGVAKDDDSVFLQDNENISTRNISAAHDQTNRAVAATRQRARRSVASKHVVAFHLSDDIHRPGSDLLSDYDDYDADIDNRRRHHHRPSLPRHKLLSRLQSDRFDSSSNLSDREVSFIERQMERRRTISEHRGQSEGCDDDTPHMERTHEVIPKSAAVAELRSLRQEKEDGSDISAAAELRSLRQEDNCDITADAKQRSHRQNDTCDITAVAELRSLRQDEDTGGVIESGDTKVTNTIESEATKTPDYDHNINSNDEDVEMQYSYADVNTDNNDGELIANPKGITTTMHCRPAHALRDTHLRRLQGARVLSTDSIELQRDRFSYATPELQHISRVLLSEPTSDNEEHDDSASDSIIAHRKRSYDCVAQSPVKMNIKRQGVVHSTGLTGEFGCVALADKTNSKRVSVEVAHFLTADELTGNNESKLSSNSDKYSTRAAIGSFSANESFDMNESSVSLSLNSTEEDELFIGENFDLTESRNLSSPLAAKSPPKSTHSDAVAIGDNVHNKELNSLYSEPCNIRPNDSVPMPMLPRMCLLQNTPPRQQSSPLTSPHDSNSQPIALSMQQPAIHPICDTSPGNTIINDENKENELISNLHQNIPLISDSSNQILTSKKVEQLPTPSLGVKLDISPISTRGLGRGAGGEIDGKCLFIASSPTSEGSQWQAVKDRFSTASSSLTTSSCGDQSSSDMDCASPAPSKHNLESTRNCALASMYTTPRCASSNRRVTSQHAPARTPARAPAILKERLVTPLASVTRAENSHVPMSPLVARAESSHVPMSPLVARGESSHVMRSPLVARDMSPMSPHIARLRGIRKKRDKEGAKSVRHMSKVTYFQSLPGSTSSCEDQTDRAHAPPTPRLVRPFMTPCMKAGACRLPLRTPKSVSRGVELEQEDRVLGTPDYLAPELLLRQPHGAGVDWWALGVCLFEFLTGVPPFNDETPELVFQNILDRNIPWPEDEEALSEEATECIEALLNMQSKLRPSASELRGMALFREFDWQHVQDEEPPFLPCPDDDTDTAYFQARNDLQNLQVSSMDLL